MKAKKKRCKDCRRPLPLSDFFIVTGGRLFNRCRICRGLRRRKGKEPAHATSLDSSRVGYYQFG